MQELGLDMSPDGFVSLSDLLSKKGFGGISVDTVRHVVATNDKQRFALKEGEGGAGLLIRANQGHSVKTVDAEQLLTPVTSAGDVPVCVHGTYKRAWPDILASGALLPMSRTHVHFAASIPPAIQARRQRTEPAAAGGERASTASAAAADDDSSAQPQLGSDEGGAEADANSTGGEQFGECAPGERAQEQSSLSAGAAVVSGLRANCQLLVHADVAKAMARGVAFYTSANGVILAPSLPLACVALVEDLTQGGAAIFRDGAPI
ncbi:phosphotransferase KptA/Tpt1 [Tribonema minus]|uniref:2'-phosphotransferase n=1 Tax=Tribonema minus TaxID=303371 RepID=A0A835YQ79_9STRA|nr:phosphotransferase KptA/Tpt1 [Tribonema minus]